jgi:hypothetical protein
MSLPFIQPAVNAVKQWASFGVNESPEQPVNPFTRKPKLSFDEQFPRINNPIRLNDHQRSDLAHRLGLSTVGNNEVFLAISRTPADTEFTDVAAFVSSVIRAWREENPTESDAAAARKLLEGSGSLAAIDAKAEAARLAAEQAEAEHRQFEKEYHNFRSIPAKYEQLTNKIASLEAERTQLNATDFNAKIRQLIEIELKSQTRSYRGGKCPKPIVATGHPKAPHGSNRRFDF